MIIFLLLQTIFDSSASENKIIQTFLHETKNLKCNIKQIVYNKNHDIISEDSGIFLFKKPNKFKLSLSNNHILYISDGNNFIQYDKISSVILINNEIYTILKDLFNTKLNIQVEEIQDVNNKKENCFRVINNSEFSLFKYVDIIFLDEKLTNISIVDIFDNIMSLEIYNLKINLDISDKEFLISLPKDVEIIKM